MDAKKNKGANVAGRVRDAVQPLIEQAGYTLWDVTFGKEVSEYILEVSIDREGGISTDDCAKVTQLIDPIIDELDPIDESYCLQVSSAGYVRELREPSHMEYAITRALPVSLRTFAAVDGRKQFDGVLINFDDEGITLLENETEVRFGKKQIAKLTAECAGSVQETF